MDFKLTSMTQGETTLSTVGLMCLFKQIDLKRSEDTKPGII